MPHIERSTFNGTGQIIKNRMKFHWHEAFVNARKWVEKINLIIICKAFRKGSAFFYN
jgi:hypothetical protein